MRFCLLSRACYCRLLLHIEPPIVAHSRIGQYDQNGGILVVVDGMLDKTIAAELPEGCPNFQKDACRQPEQSLAAAGLTSSSVASR